LGVVPRLLHVLEQPHAVDGIYGALLIGVARQQHAAGFRLQVAGARQQFDAVHLGHQVIGDDHIRLGLLEEARGLLRVRESPHFEIGLQLQECPQARDDHLFVVHDHDSRMRIRFHDHSPCTIGTRT
jgi:hypothetical protein